MVSTDSGHNASISRMPKLPIFRRRVARRMAVWNVAIWALGNGLASTTLVMFLARELHAERLGLGIGFIVAAPQIAGLLRLAAPAMIARLGNRKLFCIGTFFLGALLLLLLPWLCAPGRLPSPEWSLGCLILLWCLYHLLQYLGMVGLWSWLADVAVTPIRGHFFGWRERWLVAGQAASAIVAGLFVWGVAQTYPNVAPWVPYGIASALGAMFMLAALIPLMAMPSVVARDVNQRVETWNVIGWLEPFKNPRFWPFLAYGCWFSFFNGVTQSAQNYYPMQVLGVSLILSLSVQTAMRFGQLGISPRIGAWADRWGNRPVMIVSQLLVAAGLLFFAIASPDVWQWYLGAWVFWIAYAGLNVCLPNWLLKLSPEDRNTSYIAAFYAVTGVFYSASTILGGLVIDRHHDSAFLLGSGRGVSVFTYVFLLGWLGRSFGAVILLWIKEPSTRGGNIREKSMAP